MRIRYIAVLLLWTSLSQAQTCDAPSASQRVNVAGADVALALPASALPNALTLTAGDHALSFENAAGTVSGFVLEIPIDVPGTSFVQAQALIGRMNAQLATLGATSIPVQSNGRGVTTHDAFDATVQIHVDLPLSAATDARTLRNRVMAVLSNHALVDFGGLTGPSGATASAYTMQMAVTLRPGARMVVVGALATASAFADSASTVAHELGDVSDGSPLARAFNQFETSCRSQNAVTGADVDLLVTVYTGGNLDALRPNMTALTLSMFDALVLEGFDLRVGVVPHHENQVAQGVGNGGDLRSGFQRVRAQFETDLNNINGGDACNRSLTAVDNAIAKALPRTAVGIDNPLKLRANAQLLVLYTDGEHAQEIEQNVCGLGNLGTGQTDNARTSPNAVQQATINTIAAAPANVLLTNNAVAFGLLQALQAPFCTDLLEDGRGYAEVIAATGGSFGRVCDSNANAVLPGMLDLLLNADAIVLPSAPISSSLRLVRVPVGGGLPVEVPRSTVDGFEFDRAAQVIRIHGAAHRPDIGDELRLSFRVWGLFADGFE